MSTIAREFTKEQLQQIIETDHVQCGEASALARIALASLEAEAVCVIDQSNLDYLKSGADADVWPASRKEMGDVLLYRTAPPAPAKAEPVAWLWSHRKHPSEVSLVRPEDDERAEGAHWSGWSCQALYAAPPAPVSVPAAMEMDDDFDSAFEHGKAVGWNAYRAAMLHGAEPVSNRDELPDGWVACNERMPSAGEKVLAYRPDAPESNDPLIKMATYVGGSAHGHGFDCYCKPTHWMPLPAAPQQEA
ncbi:DUF551 domain-containing protein [Enterobacter kobei]|uniref:DUF551 domain-containing protein n=1 Tax=Enterobacter kobei TaxID=208224 RepID=UPI002FD783A9